MYGPRSIPSVGEVELSWVANPPPPLPTATSSTSSSPNPGLDAKGAPGVDEDTMMESGGEPQLDQLGARKDGNGNHEVDYDVAEVDDNWGME